MKNQINKILSSSTIVLVSHVPHTQLNCHDYFNVSPFQNLIKTVFFLLNII